MKVLFLSLFIIGSTLTGCSSSKKVIYSMEDKSKPKWASLAKTVWVEDDAIKAIGFAEGTEQSNISVLSQIADNNGKSEILRLINNRIGFYLENKKIGDSGDNSLFTMTGTEYSQENVKNLFSKERYYELVQLDIGKEFPSTKLEFYSLIEIKKSDFSKAVQDSIWSKQNEAQQREPASEDK